ncbi:MAG: type II toxin-antitoxin system RelE/ParE family toxin [Bacteroidetes bacterium]|nr:type II toxin-antitoxin system RelE/ParE family toxin [Bacteroidota bacterium]
MSYSILITPTATDDIAAAIDYYNTLSLDLGYRFVDVVSDYFSRIAAMPTASAVRYKNVRCKPIPKFPYLIAYTVDEAAQAVNILRVFNTYQEPLG